MSSPWREPEGGNAIPYWDEDPYIRREYEDLLRSQGVQSRMENSLYRKPSAAPAR